MNSLELFEVIYFIEPQYASASIVRYILIYSLIAKCFKNVLRQKTKEKFTIEKAFRLDFIEKTQRLRKNIDMLKRFSFE